MPKADTIVLVSAFGVVEGRSAKWGCLKGNGGRGHRQPRVGNVSRVGAEMNSALWWHRRRPEVLLTQTASRIRVLGGDRLDDGSVIGNSMIEELMGEGIVTESGVDPGVDVDGHANELGVVPCPGDGEMELRVSCSGHPCLGAFGVSQRQLPKLGELLIGSPKGSGRGQTVLEDRTGVEEISAFGMELADAIGHGGQRSRFCVGDEGTAATSAPSLDDTEALQSQQRSTHT